METGSSARAPRALIWLAILFLLAPAVTGCGPHIFQSGFLASWSRDGSRVALVPDLLNEDGDPAARKSGILIYHTATGQSKQIVSAGAGLTCLHAQWSPFSNDLLFITVDREDEPDSQPGKPDSYVVWCVGPDGDGLRQLATGTYLGNGEDSMALLRPHAVTWGDQPGTYLLQQRIGNKVTAILFDPHTGGAKQFLPDAADGYSLEPSPDRRKVAALLYDASSGLARLFISDFGFGNWRLLDILQYDSAQLEGLAPMIYWSPDSTRFVIPETASGNRAGEEDQGFLRLFEVGRAGSRRIANDSPQSVVQWSRDSRSLVYSAVDAEHDSNLAIYRVDLNSGRRIPLISEGKNNLMVWNSQSGRIYFYRASGRDEKSLNELSSCAGDGSDVRPEGYSFGGEHPSWSASCGGRSLIIFREPVAPTLLDIAGARAVRLQF